MRRRLLFGVALVLTVLLLGQPTSYSWGENADRLVANKAVDTLPEEMQPFFQANRQFIVQHVTDLQEAVPKSVIPFEHPRVSDFIALDHYGPFPFSALPRDYKNAISKFNRRTLDQYGVLPWQVGLYSKRLTDAFHDRNWNEAKLSAAQLAHYVTAAHDPFKTTVNFDGKLTGQSGVNDRFGTGLVDRFQLFFFVKPSEAVFVHDPTDRAFEMCLTAHSLLESVLLADRRAHAGLTGYTDEYYDRFYAQAGTLLVGQLSDAATDVGSYWMTAWINAGRPQLPSQ
ncbi:MAG TPA: hypothetical protein VN881_02450 [Candidatus Acidoferrales bacterium]|nr:hypothetical protein [Candidatus Acidoferrales bacterium]